MNRGKKEKCTCILLKENICDFPNHLSD